LTQCNTFTEKKREIFMNKPFSDEYPPLRYFANYIEKVETEDLIEALTNQRTEVETFYKTLTDETAAYRYAPGKWSLKELLGHLADAERIFAYRALCIARGETQPLPGFDENTYVENARFDELPLASLWEQYHTTRLATLALARSLPQDAQRRRGNANGHEVSARALFAIIAGHERHHLEIIEERYKQGLKD